MYTDSRYFENTLYRGIYNRYTVKKSCQLPGKKLTIRPLQDTSTEYVIVSQELTDCPPVSYLPFEIIIFKNNTQYQT